MKNQQQLVMLMIDVCLSADFLIIFQGDDESLTNFNQRSLKVENSLPDHELHISKTKDAFKTQLKRLNLKILQGTTHEEIFLRACGGTIKDHKDDVHRLRQLLGKNGASIPKHYHHLPSFLFAAEI